MPLLEHLTDVRGGVTLRGRDATRPVPGGTFAYLRISDLKPDGSLEDGELLRIEPKGGVREDHWIRMGDVLFANRGTRNTAWACSVDVPRLIAGQQFLILRADATRLLPGYLAWFLRSEAASAHFAAKRKGTLVQILEQADVKSLEIPLPPLATQAAITELAMLAAREQEIETRLAELRQTALNLQLFEHARTHSTLSPSHHP
jgi:hypothetical protein